MRTMGSRSAPEVGSEAAVAATRTRDGDGIPSTALLLVVVLTVVWGVSFPAMKVVLTEMPVFTFRSLCLLVGAAGVAAVALASGNRLALPRRLWRPLVACAVFNISIWHVASGYGLQVLPGGRAAILAYTMPFWAVIFGALVAGERITGFKVVGLSLGLAGLALLIGPDFAAVAAAPLGVVAILAAAASWGLGTVLLKRVAWETPVPVIVMWQFLVGSLPIVAGALLVDDWDGRMNAVAWLSFGFVLIGPMILCHILWFSIVRLLPASVAAISTLAIPAVGVMSSAVWLGERVAWAEAGALALVCSGLFVVLVLPAMRSSRIPPAA